MIVLTKRIKPSQTLLIFRIKSLQGKIKIKTRKKKNKFLKNQEKVPEPVAKPKAVYGNLFSMTTIKKQIKTKLDNQWTIKLGWGKYRNSRRNSKELSCVRRVQMSWGNIKLSWRKIERLRKDHPMGHRNLEGKWIRCKKSGLNNKCDLWCRCNVKNKASYHKLKATKKQKQKLSSI